MMDNRLLNKFNEKKILVIGDIMLDKHLYGHVSRISPEAPVPVLKVERESTNPGGAANLANNLAHLGAKAYLCGIVGDDEPQKILFRELEKNKIDTSCILKTNKLTIQKIRGISHQHLFRVDYEDSSPISEEEERALLYFIKDKITIVDAIIIADYAKGALTRKLVESIIYIAKQNNKLITADCKPINVDFYKGVDLLKPNKKEAIEMTLADNLEEAGKILKEKLDSNVVVTLASEGCCIFEKNKEPVTIPTVVKEFYDVGGAGDTFLATLTLSLVCNSSLVEAAEIATRASGIVICKPGVTTITIEELRGSLSNNIKTVVKDWGEEQWIVNNGKYCGKKMLIKEDYYCSYHKHKIKDETFYVFDGDIEIIKDGSYSRVSGGGVVHIAPDQYHSFRALKDTIFFEFSTQHLDEDSYRITKSGKGSHEQWKREIKEAATNSVEN
ncbi:D-glycero-beta-D-manno-heptose-7-phosphate kinase [Candidatus Woesearchaeota archaeon]|nr:D-glycero-beta-D-manno-heptose-7-phosphate kinase [Candidatus Woesearchaeota archaeon]